MKIFWASKLRGFFRHLSNGFENIIFLEKEGYYETNNRMVKIKSKLVRSPFLNPFGVFQVLSAQGQDCDAYGSFNRFLNADKPYFLYLENPTALYHYTLGRIRFRAGRKRFQKCLNDPMLRCIIFMSDACRDTFEKINMPIPARIYTKTIYPFVPTNPYATSEHIAKKSHGEYLECLYCVQGIRFVSKGGMEVISAYEKLRDSGYKIHLTVITKLSDLEKSVLARLQACSGVTLHDFSFPYNEMKKIYADTNVLLQPTSDDSFGLTILEAMKGGCAVIATKIYAIPEMVCDGYNGILLEPKYWFFDPNNIPNPAVWNHRKTTIYANKEDARLTKDLEVHIAELAQNRDLLERFSQASLTIANEKFGEDQITSQWEGVFRKL